MVTVTHTSRYQTGDAYFEFKGVSSDDKPTVGVGANSTFTELDTGDTYYFTGETWTQVGT